MNGKLIGVLSVIAFIVVVLSIITWLYSNNMIMKNMNPNLNENSSSTNTDLEQEAVPDTVIDNNAQKLIEPKEGQPIKNFSIVAKESTLEIKKGFSIPVWTYGDTVPGTEIRVVEGDFVRVELINQLKVPVTMHWHGYPVISAMDGIPGITQDAVIPGETFIYEFSADITGTYWYHSHQESSTQVDMGL